MRRLVSLVLLALLTLSPLAAAPAEPDLATGIRQVQEGDFEGAVVTLQAVTKKLTGQAARRQELAQAHLYLGIAQVALDQRDPAKAAFKAALALNKDLRLTPDRFSPKVIGVFEEARKESEAAAAAGAPGGKGGGKTLLWVGLGGAAVGAAAVIASGGGDDGAVSLSNARFTEPVIVCANGSVNVELPFSVLVDADNPTSNTLAIDTVDTIAVITASPDFPSEVGFSSRRPSSVVPSGVAAGARATLRVTSTLLCGNSPGDPARSNSWLARLTFTTSAGAIIVETIDRMRVDLP